MPPNKANHWFKVCRTGAQTDFRQGKMSPAVCRRHNCDGCTPEAHLSRIVTDEDN